MTHVLWLYGVTPGGLPRPLVEAVELAAIGHAGLVALVEPLPAADFTPAALEAKLQSMEWVAGWARRHQAVLAAAMAHGPVIPARFATLFTGPDAVAGALASGRARFLATIERVSGSAEWGVKIFCDHRRLAAILAADEGQLPPAQPPSAATGTTSGLAYILAKRRMARAEELAVERAFAVADEVLDALAPCVVESRQRPLLDARVSGRDDTMEVNLAALVELGREDALRAVVSEAASRFGPCGFTLQMSGPFAPYSFCDDDPPSGPAPATDTAEQAEDG